MQHLPDAALVFLNTARDPALPATHVLIIGVGKYAYGRAAQQSLVAGDLVQLSSPPISARAMTDWFIGSFRNQNAPLGSVALLLSEHTPTAYVAPPPTGGG